MIIKFTKPIINDNLPIRWLFKDYYRVVDEKLFFVLVIKHGIQYTKIEDESYGEMLYSDLGGVIRVDSQK